MGVGRLSLCEFDGSDPQRPDIRFAIVLVLRQHLRAHPKRTPDEGVLVGQGVHQLGRYPEIGQLDVAEFIDEDVSCFNVAMDRLALVQILEPQQGRLQNRGNMLFGESRAWRRS